MIAEHKTQINRLTKELEFSEEELRVNRITKQSAEQSLQKLLMSEREVMRLNADIEKMKSELFEWKSRFEFVESQNKKLKNEVEEINNVDSKDC